MGKVNYKEWSSSKTAKKKLTQKMFEAKTVGEVLSLASRLWARKPYLIFAPTDDMFTYSEFNFLAMKVAEVLRNYGIEKGERVALFMKNSPAYLACIFACSKLGAVQVPVNWFYREKEVQYIVSNSKSKIVVADDDLVPIVENVRRDIPSLKEVVVTSELMSKANRAPGRVKGARVKETDPFAIIYTSGTTGLPKGAVLTHRSYVLAAKAIALWPIEEIESDYTCLPLFHINAQIYSSLGMMVSGRKLILSDRFSPQKFWEEIKKYKATAFNALGSLMQIIYALPESPTDKDNPAKYVIVGGTPKELWERFEERFRVRILEGYSQTEDPLPFLNYPYEDGRVVGSFGIPAFWDLKHQVKVVDDEGKAVKPGERGELIRRSPCTMLGYWKDERRTKETVKNGWLYSGDVVIRDKNGFTYFVERKKFIIRRSGENIAAWEVEAVIKSHPFVKDCAVIPVPDPLRGEEVKAVVLPAEGKRVDPVDIIKHVGKQLAYFKVPRYIEVVSSLPYTPTGRVKKHELIAEEKNKEEHGWDRDKKYPDWKKDIS